MSVETGRWAVEQVLALAPRPSSIAAAQPLAVPARWSGLGCDDRAVWGRCSGSSAEPYDTVVDHVQHMLAFFPDNSNYIMVTFENQLNGGDGDYNDTVIVIDVGPDNASLWRNSGNLPK